MEWAHDRYETQKAKSTKQGKQKTWPTHHIKVHTMPLSNGKSEVRITGNPSLENMELSLHSPLFLSLSLYRQLPSSTFCYFSLVSSFSFYLSTFIKHWIFKLETPEKRDASQPLAELSPMDFTTSNPHTEANFFFFFTREVITSSSSSFSVSAHSFESMYVAF